MTKQTNRIAFPCVGVSVLVILVAFVSTMSSTLFPSMPLHGDPKLQSGLYGDEMAPACKMAAKHMNLKDEPSISPKLKSQELKCSEMVKQLSRELISSHVVCEAKETTPEQELSFVNDYMQTHPKRLHWPLEDVVSYALITTMPCKGTGLTPVYYRAH